jgi:hypothetical protein
MTPTGRRPDSFGLMARGAGALWIVTILCGIFAEAYVRGQLIVTVRQPRNGPPEANARNGSKADISRASRAPARIRLEKSWFTISEPFLRHNERLAQPFVRLR